MSLLDARNLSVAFGERRVLDTVDFALDAGELVGLLGPNGAGKTTLLRSLAGLQAVQAGVAMLLGKPIDGYALSERARRLAYLPQSGQCHWPMTVAQVVSLGRLPHRAPWARVPASDSEAVNNAMAAADVAYLSDRPATELSGGERARVLLARALAVEAQVLLADEPTAGLDPAHQLRVMELLRTRAQGGTGVVVTLHDLTLASRYCDRIVLLDTGRVVADAAAAAVLSAENLQKVYGIEASYLQTDTGLLVVPTKRR